MLYNTTISSVKIIYYLQLKNLIQFQICQGDISPT